MKSLKYVIAMLVVMAFIMMPVLAYDDHVNKYAPIGQTYNYAQDGAPGSVIFYMRGVTVQDHNVIVWNDLTPEINETVTVLPQGDSGPISPWAAGHFSWYVKQGNGDQPESGHFTVGHGETTRVNILGAAIPTAGEDAPVKYEILKAQYGAVQITYQTVHHEATPDITAYYTVVKVSHDHGNCDKVDGRGRDYDFMSDGQKYEKVSHGDYQYTYHPMVKGKSAWDEQVPITTGTFADVTQYFQSHLNKNTVSPTITGASNDWSWLLSFQSFYGTFPDPATGIVKGIVVDYTVNGAVKQIVVPDVNAASTTITL